MWFGSRISLSWRERHLEVRDGSVGLANAIHKPGHPTLDAGSHQTLHKESWVK